MKIEHFLKLFNISDLLEEKKKNKEIIASILTALKANEFEKAKEILTKISWKHLKSDSQDIFVFFVKSGDIDFLQKLLCSNELAPHIDINKANSAGYTALTKACASGHLEVVRYLLNSSELKLKIKINHLDELNHTPLMSACYWGHLDIVKYLLTSSELKEKSKINQYNYEGQTAVTYATMRDNVEIVDYLLTSPDLKEHAKVEEQDVNGNDIYLTSCFKNSYKTLSYLLTNPKVKEKVNMRALNNKGQDAFYLASFFNENREDTLKVLILENNFKLNYSQESKLKQSVSKTFYSDYQKVQNYIKINKELPLGNDKYKRKKI